MLIFGTWGQKRCDHAANIRSKGEIYMSTRNRFTGLARAGALSLALALPAASAALAQDATQAPAGGWYANINNPHPELSGFPKIARSDNLMYANTNDPHPEINRRDAGVAFATNGSGAPLQAQAGAGQLSEQSK